MKAQRDETWGFALHDQARAHSAKTRGNGNGLFEWRCPHDLRVTEVEEAVIALRCQHLRTQRPHDSSLVSR